MGDQKYLDEWPARYSSLCVLQHLGAGLAPWNYPNYTIESAGVEGTGNGPVLVDGQALIFYHFHQFHLLDDGGFDRLSSSYTAERAPPEEVYRLYEKSLAQVVAEVQLLEPGFTHGMKSTAYIRSRRWAHRFLPQRLKDFLKRIVKY